MDTIKEAEKVRKEKTAKAKAAKNPAKEKSKAKEKTTKTAKPKNQELAVRHFLVTKYFKPNGSEVSYFEYERDRFKKNSFGYSFYYQVSRWNSRAETMLWRDSKPYQGYMWSMRNIFYEDEYLYSKTQYEDECAVTAQESAESVMIGLNNSFLQETLNACPSDTLKVQYDGALSPVLFRSKSEQAEIVQAIVPMRLAAE